MAIETSSPTSTPTIDSGRLVHCNFVGAIGSGAAPAEDPVALDLDRRSDRRVDPESEVSLDAVDHREHDRERTGRLDHRQSGDRVGDLGIDRADVDRDVGGARFTFKAVDAACGAAGSCERDEYDGPRQADQQCERDDQSASAAPVGAHPERDSPVHRFIGYQSSVRCKHGAHLLVGVLPPQRARHLSSLR